MTKDDFRKIAEFCSEDRSPVQKFIEYVVLPKGVDSYTVEEMAGYIENYLTNRTAMSHQMEQIWKAYEEEFNVN